MADMKVIFDKVDSVEGKGEILLELLTTQSWLVMTLKNIVGKDIVGKGEDAGNQHLLMFPQFFYSIIDRNDNFSNIWYVVCKCFEFGLVQNSVIW